MKRLPWVPNAVKAAPTDVHWTVIVTEPLPNCPSIKEGWVKIATQTKWGEWRSESKMRGKEVVATVVPPATEPLKAGNEYIVKVSRFMRIRCRVLESSSVGAPSGEDDEMVFDAMGVAFGGIVNARFRFTVFRAESGVVMARAQEKMITVPFLALFLKETLASEHRHTFKDLNHSFSSASN